MSTDDLIENLSKKIRKESVELYNKSETINQYLRALVKEAGGKFVIFEESVSMFYRGFGCSIIDENNFEIVLRPGNSEFLENFYIAKALGYFFIFGKVGETGFFNFYSAGRDFFISNKFATALLMPRKELKKSLKKYKNNKKLVANNFQISSDFVDNRIDYVKKSSSILYKIRKEKSR